MNKKLAAARKLADEVKAERGVETGVEVDRRGNFSVIEINRYNEDDEFIYRTDK